MEIKEKYCKRCKKTKPVSEFSKDKYNKNGLRNQCRKCCSEIFSAWRKRTSRDIKAKSRLKERRRRYYLKNREKIINKSKAYGLSESGREVIRKRRERNKDKILKQKRESYQRNKASYRIWSRAGKARKAGAIGSFGLKEWTDLISQFDDHCVCCWDTVKLTMDHVVPVSMGGTNCISNIQPLCKTCNSRKRTETVDYRPIAIMKLTNSKVH